MGTEFKNEEENKDVSVTMWFKAGQLIGDHIILVTFIAGAIAGSCITKRSIARKQKKEAKEALEVLKGLNNLQIVDRVDF